MRDAKGSAPSCRPPSLRRAARRSACRLHLSRTTFPPLLTSNHRFAGGRGRGRDRPSTMPARPQVAAPVGEIRSFQVARPAHVRVPTAIFHTGVGDHTAGCSSAVSDNYLRGPCYSPLRCIGSVRRTASDPARPPRQTPPCATGTSRSGRRRARARPPGNTKRLRRNRRRARLPPHDFGLRQVDQRRAYPQPRALLHAGSRREIGHGLEGRDELRAAIGITGVIDGIHANEDIVRMQHFCPGERERQKYGVARRHVGDRNSGVPARTRRPHHLRAPRCRDRSGPSHRKPQGRSASRGVRRHRGFSRRELPRASSALCRCP